MCELIGMAPYPGWQMEPPLPPTSIRRWFLRSSMQLKSEIINAVASGIKSVDHIVLTIFIIRHTLTHAKIDIYIENW